MKLNLLFILVDLLIILAYPFVFIWDKLQPILANIQAATQKGSLSNSTKDAR